MGSIKNIQRHTLSNDNFQKDAKFRSTRQPGKFTSMFALSILICCYSLSTNSKCEAFTSSITPALSSPRTSMADLSPMNNLALSASTQKKFDAFQRKNARHAHSRTTLQMSAISTMTASSVLGALSGGLFSGGLHAISGPDHLAAIVPKCCGQRWFKAGRIGILWGMGHGISATMLGVAAFALKNRLPERMGGILHGASSTMEIAIGVSLVLIGVLGVKESKEWLDEIDAGTPQSLSAAANPDAAVTVQAKRAVVFNGLLHGFSWDGAPSLAPALAVATWRGSLTFLFSYALGTMATMALATVAIGEGTRRAGQILHRPDIPQKVSFYSSWIAIAVGFFWIRLAFV